MRKIGFAAVLSAVFCALFLLPVFGAGGDGVSAESYIVTDDMGRELFSCQPDKRMAPASTAKLLTALVAAENCERDKTIVITSAHVATEGSLMYLRPGETVSLGDLLHGLLLASGNDAALAVADLVCGGTEEFVQLMNTKAAELGMDSSRFSNPSGLPDENTYTTARDLSRLIAAFSQNGELMKISGTREAVLDGRTVVNHNRLISTLSGVDGGKTGYTKKAGRCLVTTAERNSRRVFVVTLNAPEDWADHEKLYSKAFGLYEKTELGGLLPVCQDIVGGERDRVRVECSSVPVLWLSEAEREALRSVTYMRRFEYAPVKPGGSCGKTVIFCGDKPLLTVGLYYCEAVYCRGTDNLK
ncbi:MAG: D-alanyl-D-alanine carboxypeptidase [Ruminococcaceae bacterium]|nr:D-alanyl-D-alanine carboxypeptidase [Oscillospiraceae bacterium]